MDRFMMCFKFIMKFAFQRRGSIVGLKFPIIYLDFEEVGIIN